MIELRMRRWFVPVVSALILFTFNAFAQDDNDEEEAVEEVLVLGTYIKGTNVNVTSIATYDQEYITAIGEPNVEEFLTYQVEQNNSYIRNANTFSGTGKASQVNVSLRGLTANRTLVMLNGKRAIWAGSGDDQGFTGSGVDIGNFPEIAWERTEVLRSGGATLYGSTAMAGVWNFVTEQDFEGFKLHYTHGTFDGFDGQDDRYGFMYGTGGEKSNWIFAYEGIENDGYHTRDLRRYDYCDPADTQNCWPQGYSSFGYPGTIVPQQTEDALGVLGDEGHLLSAGWSIADPDCGYYNAEWNAFSWSDSNFCRYSYSSFWNLVEDHTRQKMYLSVTSQASENVEVYGWINWATLDTDNNESPSYPPTHNELCRYITDRLRWNDKHCLSTGASFMVPVDSPGVQNYLGTLSPESAAAVTHTFDDGTQGIRVRQRPVATSGPPKVNTRFYTTLTSAFGIRGDVELTDALGAWSYDLSFTWNHRDTEWDHSDILFDRYVMALNGLAGFECPRQAWNPDDPRNAELRFNTDAGCYGWNALGSSLTSPNATLQNLDSTHDWFNQTGPGAYERSEFWIAEGVFSGDLPLNLPGGQAGLAVGGQIFYQDIYWDQKGAHRLEDVNEQKSPDDWVPLIFLGNLNVSGGQYKVDWFEYFGELYLPIHDKVQVQLALRHANYDIVDTTHTSPMMNVKYQPLDWLELRLGLENTFRVQTIVRDQRIVTLYQCGIVGPNNCDSSINSQTAADAAGVPFFGDWIPIITRNAGVDPEESDNINFGMAIASFPILPALSLDLELYQINVQGMWASASPSDWVISYNESGEPSGIVSSLLNGPDATIQGIDYTANYFRDMLDGTAYASMNGTYMVQWEVGGFDVAGKWSAFCACTPIQTGSYPQHRINLITGFRTGPHDVRTVTRVVSGYDVIPGSRQIWAGDTHPRYITEIDAHTIVDLYYTYEVPWVETVDMKVTFGVRNMFDAFSPFAPHEMTYDSLVHEPWGRNFKMTFDIRMGQ